MTRVLCGLLAATAVLAVISMGLGDQQVGAIRIGEALLWPGDSDPATLMIVWQLRLPRVVLALLAGSALGVAGAISQTVMRNPLAEPGILGINSGAALAALAVMVILQRTSPVLVAFSAFAGAFTMAALIYVLSWRSGASSIRIILIGIGLGAFASAGASFISVFGDVTMVQSAQVWLAGSVYNANWDEVRVLSAWLLPTFGIAVILHRELDLMSFDDISASGLGLRVQIARGGLVLICAMLSAAAVAVAGVIGFVGLIVPHVARKLVGHRHIAVLPVAGAAGACLLLCADLVGRTVIAPAELPAGLVIVLIGVPFFGFLLWKRHDARG